MARTTKPKSARIHLRTTRGDYLEIVRAAKAANESITDFVLGGALDRVRREERERGARVDGWRNLPTGIGAGGTIKGTP